MQLINKKVTKSYILGILFQTHTKSEDKLMRKSKQSKI